MNIYGSLMDTNIEPTENSITLMNGAVLECFPKKIATLRH